MGRAKLNMELIPKEKSRNITFKKRKDGLIRKMHEFTTLCDVSACMIIYGPKQDQGVVAPEIWPRDPDEVRRIIDTYKSKNKDAGNKNFSLSDFFNERKRKIEEELAKLRKKNMETKHPTWVDCLNNWTESELREFAIALSNKVDYAKSRLEFLKMNKFQGGGFDMNNLVDFTHARMGQSHNYYTPGLIQQEFEMQVINQPAYHQFPFIDHHQQQQELMNQNSMMLMNGNDHYAQYGSTSSESIQCASFKGHVYAAGMDLTMCHNLRPLAHYYSPPVLEPPYLQIQALWEENYHGGGSDGGDEEDIDQNQPMNYNGGGGDDDGDGEEEEIANTKFMGYNHNQLS